MATAIADPNVKLPLDGYRTTRLLRASRAKQVYAAVRECDQRPVVAKVYELDGDEGLEARVEHEFRLIHGLEVDGVVRALALEHSGSRLALILDYCQGVNLEEYCGGKPLPIPEFLDIALQITRALADIHGQRVVHRDIKPTNLLIDPHSKRVSIADFGISVLLESERERINDPEIVEGTLPYVSPEQTGRTHREVDFRSDLYSLGVTCFELLTGRRPFVATTPLELIHDHLARRPEAPQWLRPEIPTPLSAMVMKLLEKAPERRYQSARGLHRDLARLAEALAAGRELENFDLGSEDVPAALQLPHRLYGRTHASKVLAKQLRLAATGQPRCVAISGPAGIGKSALFETLTEPVLGRGGYLARGKFDRERGDKPYAGFIALFSELADQLLTESDAKLERWRRTLRQAIGPLGAAVVELVPKLRPVIGPGPSIQEFGPLEAQKRLALACARLLAAFAKPEHPLVLALDDVHWADAASCDLLGRILAEPGAALLVVVTLREDQLAPGHPLRELRDVVERERRQLVRLELGPLAREDVVALIADALARPHEQVRGLAELVGRKTNDNPFFVRQFLTHLVELGLLRPGVEGWSWDAQAIEAAGIPEDLLAMMTTKLARLGPQPRQLLLAAAAIGTRFDLATLEGLVGAEVVAAALVPLIDEGLITSLGAGRHGFTHDRIREVAYHMAPIARRVALHLQIGALRLARVGMGELAENVFEVVDHVDLGHGLIPLADEEPAAAAARAERALASLDEGERGQLADLNALAGYKALTGASAEAAWRYLSAGVRLIARDQSFPPPGQPGHTLRFALEMGLGQALALSGRGEEAERQFEALLAAPLDDSDIGRAVAKRIELRILAGDRSGAVTAGVEGLARLGVGFAEHSGQPIAALLADVEPLLTCEQARSLGKRRRLRDARVKAALEVLMAVSSAAFFVDVGLHVLMVGEHLRLLFAHGRHLSAPLAVVQGATLLGAVLGRHREAGELAEVARELARVEGPGCPQHRVEPAYWLMASWTRPFAEALSPLRESAARALEAGDLEFAGLATAMHVAVSLAAGQHLRNIERTSDVALHRLQQWRADDQQVSVLAHQRFAERMLAGDPEAIVRDLADPLGLAAALSTLDSPSALYTVRLLEARLCLFFDQPARALALLDALGDIDQVMLGAWHLAEHTVIRGLAAARLCHEPEHAEARARLQEIVEASQVRLRAWAALAPENVEHLALLLEGELTALREGKLPALAVLARARRAAAAARMPLFEALAYERMANLVLAEGITELGAGPIRDAVARYHHWGGFSKAVALERRWPELFADGSRASEASSGEATRTGQTSNTTSGRTLDMATVLKTSQAIAEDIRLGEVVQRVLAIALENAGAERGALLLPGPAGLELAASCSAGAAAPVGADHGEARVPIERAGDRVPVSLLHWVERTREPVVLDDASGDMRFAGDPYVEAQRVQSVLCLPIVKHSRLVAMLYLENRLSAGSFSAGRLEVLRLLMAQAGSALENAQLYEALRGSEVRWRSLVEGLPDVIMLVDRRGRIEFINHLENESERNRILGMFAGAYIVGEHLPALRAAMTEVIAGGELQELELQATLPGRSQGWYAVRLAPIVVDGRVDRIIAVGTDITARREAAAATAALEAQLRQQQRLESIGTLASGVAHEINNPVQGIMNYAELIASSEAADDLIREFAGEIDHESQRVATIVRNLLAFSRQESEFTAAPSKVGGIIEGTLSLIRTVLRRDQIGLQVDIPDELPLVPCRPQQIQQVIMNLVTNARDALTANYPEFHDNKRIEISAGGFVRDGRSWVRISVLDRGGGVPEAVVSQIFDPFFTTKGRDQGTGLGLAVSHGIVAEHGGELTLDNRPGDAACFNIDLPALADDEA